MWEYVVAAAVGGVAVGMVGGVFLEKLLKSMKENRILKCSELLEKNFGEPMVTNKFTFAEVKEWIMARESKIKDGYKGTVMKVNKESFAKLGSNLVIDKNLENYLLLAIYKDGNFDDTLLVKYGSLDSDLEANLKEGTMVIE